MSPRAEVVDAAFKWGIPLHIWDGTGPAPSEEQKAEMLAYVKASNKMQAHEDRMNEPKTGSGGIKIGG